MAEAPTLMTRSILKPALFVIGGAALGFGYYYFIGCTSGHCPITSNPIISTAYGALVGLVAAGSLVEAAASVTGPLPPRDAPRA